MHHDLPEGGAWRRLSQCFFVLNEMRWAALRQGVTPALQRPLMHARHTDGARRGVRVTKGRGAVRRRPWTEICESESSETLLAEPSSELFRSARGVGALHSSRDVDSAYGPPLASCRRHEDLRANLKGSSPHWLANCGGLPRLRRDVVRAGG